MEEWELNVYCRFDPKDAKDVKPKKLALIAAMRKLVLIAHAIYKNKVAFSIA